MTATRLEADATQLFVEIERLYGEGQYFTAFQRVRRGGIPGRAARDIDPKVALLAARVIAQVGGGRRGRRMMLEVWRAHRRHPEACVWCAYALMSDGPLRVLEFMDTVGQLESASSETQADWLGVRALQLAALRDFRGAEDAWSAAKAIWCDPWTWCIEAIIEDRRDRPERARAAVAEARSMQEWFRPAVEIEARLLLRTRQWRAARDLLEEAARRLQSAAVLLSLHERCVEEGDLDRALECVERAIGYLPMMERQLHDEVARCLSRVHYLRGEPALSAWLARMRRGEQMQSVADEIERAADVSRRKLLPVPQIPQHHRTCAPATLTSIAEFWGEPVSHLEIAEEICHDGTPAVSERRWAEERGFLVREFTVTWETAVRLVDAGLPFSLVTVFPGSAHAQAVAGYDPNLRLLLVRDPSSFALQEYAWDPLAVSQAAFGPRGMVFVPPSARAAIEPLELPDAGLYDLHFAVEDALRRHDRAAAEAACEELGRRAPDHRLRHQARRALAGYDGNARGLIEWADAMLSTAPDDGRLLLSKLVWLQGLESRATRLDIAGRLLGVCPGDPAVLAMCAELHAEVPEGKERAHALARRAVRAGFTMEGFRTLANLRWESGEHRRATRLYRFASCLDETNEPAAWSYFLAARLTGATGEGLAHLRDRVELMAARSAQPARTLCDAFTVLDRASEVFAILDDALARHPEDGALMLVAADRHRLAGEVERARELLERARGRCHDGAWRRCAAALAAHEGDMEVAARLWRELVEETPLDVETQHEYVRHLVCTGSVEAALEHLMAVCTRFPYHVALHQLRHRELQQHAADQAAAHLESFLERHPTDPWALTELALAVAARGDLARAHELLDRAGGVGAHAGLACARASLRKIEGRRDLARELYREAIDIDVDHPGAVTELVRLAGDGKSVAGELDRVAAALDRQGSRGPGLLAWANALLAQLDQKSALDRLAAWRARHDDRWIAWSAEVQARLAAGELDAAADLASEAVRRFQLVPGAWIELGMVQGRRGERRAQVAALERAVEIEPRWLHAVRLLAEALAAAGDAPRARATLERAVAMDPLDAINHGFLAELSWTLEDRPAALQQLRQALRLDPTYEWAWLRLVEWSPEPPGQSDVAAFAREIVERAPAAIRPRIVLAELAAELTVDERIAHLDAAIRAAPERAEAADAKAELLAGAGRWEEALAACRPPFWGDEAPVNLRGRAAWIRQRRGDGEAAWEDMLRAIESVPSYEWGIEQLAHWASRDGNEQYLRMATRIAKAAPASAPAHAHLGEALRLSGRDGEAEASLRRALAIEPTHALGRLGLFDVLLARDECEQARQLLDGMSDDNPWVLARRVQLAAVSGRPDDADAGLLRLFRTRGPWSSPVTEAIAGYRKAGLGDHLGRLLQALVERADATAAVGWAWWTEVAGARARRWRWRRIREMPDSAAARWCGAYHIEEYGDKEHRWRFRFFFACHRRVLRARTAFWGSVGYCLLRFGRIDATVWWLGDRGQRKDVQPWMLLNLVRAMMALDMAGSGWSVCRDARLLPRDHTAAIHDLIDAAPCALDGRVDEARVTLERALPDSSTDEERVLAGLAEAVIGYCAGDRSLAEKRTAFEEAVLRTRRRIPRRSWSSLCLNHYRQLLRRLERQDPSDFWDRMGIDH